MLTFIKNNKRISFSSFSSSSTLCFLIFLGFLILFSLRVFFSLLEHFLFFSLPSFLLRFSWLGSLNLANLFFISSLCSPFVFDYFQILSSFSMDVILSLHVMCLEFLVMVFDHFPVDSVSVTIILIYIILLNFTIVFHLS